MVAKGDRVNILPVVPYFYLFYAFEEPFQIAVCSMQVAGNFG